MYGYLALQPLLGGSSRPDLLMCVVLVPGFSPWMCARAAMLPLYYSSHSPPVSQSFLCFASVVSGLVNGQREHRTPFRLHKRCLWRHRHPSSALRCTAALRFLLSSDPVQNHIREPLGFPSICFTSRNKLLKRKIKYSKA